MSHTMIRSLYKTLPTLAFVTNTTSLLDPTPPPAQIKIKIKNKPHLNPYVTPMLKVQRNHLTNFEFYFDYVSPKPTNSPKPCLKLHQATYIHTYI